MSWKDILKASCGGHREKIDTEKGSCGCASCEKQQFEKKLVGNQNEIDANDDGEITGKDFEILRERTKKAAKDDKTVEKEILVEVKKEGGALGMKNLKGIADDTQLNKVVNSMLKRKVLFKHKNGDLYTHNPVR